VFAAIPNLIVTSVLQRKPWTPLKVFFMAPVVQSLQFSPKKNQGFGAFGTRKILTASTRGWGTYQLIVLHKDAKLKWNPNLKTQPWALPQRCSVEGAHSQSNVVATLHSFGKIHKSIREYENPNPR
jgi:hypothetical protein